MEVCPQEVVTKYAVDFTSAPTGRTRSTKIDIIILYDCILIEVFFFVVVSTHLQSDSSHFYYVLQLASFIL